MLKHNLQTTVGVLLLIMFSSALPAGAATGQLQISVVDKDTGKPIACRMHLVGPKKKPFKPEKSPFWQDHFVFPGNIVLRLPLGDYSFVIERGLEYRDWSGRFTINHFADDSTTIKLQRFIDMAADGWWSGDLDVRRPARDIELLMEADDLHIAQVITWRNDESRSKGTVPFLQTQKSGQSPLVQFDGNRFYHLLAGAYTQPGTELLLLNLAAPVKLPPANAAYASFYKTLSAAREKGDLWVDLTKPFWWDLPMLAAAGQLDSIELAHSHLHRSGTRNDEADGYARDRKRYPTYKGDAEWSHEIYFRLLECGLRIPPSAGSGSGEAPNPVGYNRAYVHVDGPLTYEKWWQQLRAGQVFITNGPLMKPLVEGELPGHVFHADQGEKLELDIGLTFSTRDPIDYMEIIKNGHVEREIRFEEYAKSRKLPKVEFDRSGWFLIRAVANHPKTFRFAMTGPYYVEIGYEKRISKRAAQFFLDWVERRAKQIKPADTAEQKELNERVAQARNFWKDLAAKANAD
jgi:hypothetical protein